jgi:hypothetical protein
MQTITDKQKNALKRKFHALLAQAGIDNDGKRDIVESFGEESTSDLSIQQLVEACAAVERIINPALAETDKWRKRLIASIGGWLKAMNRESNIDQIKGIACRAAGITNFNRISEERLRSLYYAFRKKQKDLDMVEQITSDELDVVTSLN